jgi:3-methylfumaryl-CoA hydratase
MQPSDLVQPIKSKETCSLTMVRRVAAMLDLETASFSEGGILPRGWHFFMLAGSTRKSDLRQDGFPGLGVPMPDLGLPRLLLGGRTVAYKNDLVIGSVIEKTSFVKSIVEKTPPSGRMAIVTLQHELRPVSDAHPAIVETQTYILLENKGTASPPPPDQLQSLPNVGKSKEFVPDETLLFQYSALGFNSHKIHLDRHYTQNVEGLPDLVVNGGLATLLLTEFISTDLELELSEIKVKHLAPLFCNRKMTLFSDGGLFKIFDDNNAVAVEMTAETLQATSLHK